MLIGLYLDGLFLHTIIIIYSNILECLIISKYWLHL